MSGKLLGAELNDGGGAAAEEIMAEKEEGGRVVMGKNMIQKKRQDSVQGRDVEMLVVGGGGQSKPGEVMVYSCPNCYKMLPST